MKLKDLIKDKLMVTTTELCKECGISRQTIFNIMHDKNVSLLTIKKICAYFKVDFHEYIECGGSNEKLGLPRQVQIERL